MDPNDDEHANDDELDDDFESGSSEEDDSEVTEEEDNGEPDDDNEDDADEASDGSEEDEVQSTSGKSRQRVASGSDSDLSDGQAERCAICLSRYLGQEIGSPNNCDHNYCAECILEWSQNMSTCPVDRKSFTLILIRSEIEGKVLRQIPVQNATENAEELADEDHTFCEICEQSNREDRMLLCDGCDLGFHLECLNPPLRAVPIEEWFCPACSAENQQNLAAAADIEDGELQALLDDQPAIVGPRRVPNRTRLLPRTIQSERVRRVIQNRRAAAGTPKKKRKTRRKTKTRKRKTTKSKSSSSGKSSSGKVRRRRKGRRRRRRTSRKVKIPRITVAKTPQERIAEQLGVQKILPKHFLPVISTGGRSRSRDLSSLRLFGEPNELIAFDDSNYELASENGSEVATRHVRRRVKTNLAMLSHRSLAPQVPSLLSSNTTNSFDLLGSILSSQTQLQLPSQQIQIGRDGYLRPNSLTKTTQRPTDPVNVNSSSTTSLQHASGGSERDGASGSSNANTDHGRCSNFDTYSSSASRHQGEQNPADSNGGDDNLSITSRLHSTVSKKKKKDEDKTKKIDDDDIDIYSDIAPAFDNEDDQSETDAVSGVPPDTGMEELSLLDGDSRISESTGPPQMEEETEEDNNYEAEHGADSEDELVIDESVKHEEEHHQVQDDNVDENSSRSSCSRSSSSSRSSDRNEEEEEALEEGETENREFGEEAKESEENVDEKESPDSPVDDDAANDNAPLQTEDISSDEQEQDDDKAEQADSGSDEAEVDEDVENKQADYDDEEEQDEAVVPDDDDDDFDGVIEDDEDIPLEKEIEHLVDNDDEVEIIEQVNAGNEIEDDDVIVTEVRKVRNGGRRRERRRSGESINSSSSRHRHTTHHQSSHNSRRHSSRYDDENYSRSKRKNDEHERSTRRHESRDRSDKNKKNSELDNRDELEGGHGRLSGDSSDLRMASSSDGGLGGEISWKKLSQSSKTRNYRDNRSRLELHHLRMAERQKRERDRQENQPPPPLPSGHNNSNQHEKEEKRRDKHNSNATSRREKEKDRERERDRDRRSESSSHRRESHLDKRKSHGSSSHSTVSSKQHRHNSSSRTSHGSGRDKVKDGRSKDKKDRKEAKKEKIKRELERIEREEKHRERKRERALAAAAVSPSGSLPPQPPLPPASPPSMSPLNASPPSTIESKEVYASGDKIIINVNFARTKSHGERERTKKRHHHSPPDTVEEKEMTKKKRTKYDHYRPKGIQSPPTPPWNPYQVTSTVSTNTEDDSPKEELDQEELEQDVDEENDIREDDDDVMGDDSGGEDENERAEIEDDAEAEGEEQDENGSSVQGSIDSENEINELDLTDDDTKLSHTRSLTDDADEMSGGKSEENSAYDPFEPTKSPSDKDANKTPPPLPPEMPPLPPEPAPEESTHAAAAGAVSSSHVSAGSATTSMAAAISVNQVSNVKLDFQAAPTAAAVQTSSNSINPTATFPVLPMPPPPTSAVLPPTPITMANINIRVPPPNFLSRPPPQLPPNFPWQMGAAAAAANILFRPNFLSHPPPPIHSANAGTAATAANNVNVAAAAAATQIRTLLHNQAAQLALLSTLRPTLPPQLNLTPLQQQQPAQFQTNASSSLGATSGSNLTQTTISQGVNGESGKQADTTEVVDMDVDSPYSPGDTLDSTTTGAEPSAELKKGGGNSGGAGTFDSLMGSSQSRKENVPARYNKGRSTSGGGSSSAGKASSGSSAHRSHHRGKGETHRKHIVRFEMTGKQTAAGSASGNKKDDGKKEVVAKMDESQLKILDELPSSAVEMQVKEKFLKKLNRQERVIEEVKLAVKPYYNRREINKEEYKEILRKSVPKICHNKSGEINPVKIKALVEGYVKKFKYQHKKDAKGSGGAAKRS